MHFKCHEAHPYKNLIEYINMTEAAGFIEDYLNLVSTVEFADNRLVTSNKIVLQYTDFKNIRNILSNNDFLHLIIHRYINSLHEIIIAADVESTEVFIRLGEFRERIIKHFSKFDPIKLSDFSKWFKTDIADMDNVDYYKGLLLMETNLPEKGKHDRETSIKFMCSPYFEKIDEQAKQYKKTEGLSNVTSADSGDHYYIESLVIPKMKPLSNLSDFIIKEHEYIQESQVYLNSPKFNNHIKNLLDTKLGHHINKIGKNGYINKNKVYSSYGVTPHLTRSTNKTSEEVHKYDKDLKEIEKNLSIDQIITISFLMYLRYSLDKDNDSHEKELDRSQSVQSLLHQIITSPNSQFTVPKNFLTHLQYEIRSYAKKTVLSRDSKGTKDNELVELIELFLSSRFALPTLNDYNNFLILIRQIENNVLSLAIAGADHNSFLEMNEFLYNIQSAYNEWIQEINDDKNCSYKKNYEYIRNRLLIKDSPICQVDEGLFIKERFKTIINS